MSAAQVTIPLDEFNQIQNEKKEAEEATAKLKQEVMEAKIASCDPDLLALARAALDICRYAVASIPPESNVGWPFESLRTVADHVTKMPDATADHTELATTFRIFAKECEDNERRRMLNNRVKQAAPREIVAPATTET